MLLTLLVPAGSPISSGQTFSTFPFGHQGSAGQFQLTLSPDLNNPANAGVLAPDGTGTLTIDSIGQLSDGTYVAQNSFSIQNGSGASITGKGVGKWK